MGEQLYEVKKLRKRRPVNFHWRMFSIKHDTMLVIIYIWRAPIEQSVAIPGYEDVEAGIVKWPLSVLRIRHKDEKRLIDLAERVLDCWRSHVISCNLIILRQECCDPISVFGGLLIFFYIFSAYNISGQQFQLFFQPGGIYK